MDKPNIIRPSQDKITRAEAMDLCFDIIRSRRGEKLSVNIFRDAVNELMEEINGTNNRAR